MPIVRRQPVALLPPPGLGAALLLAASLPRLAAAQDTEWNRYTLEGLPGVRVVAETNEGCQGAGLVAEAVREEAEAMLGESGVRLLGREEMLEAPGLPELRVSLECGGGVSGMVGYAVSVRVQQAVQMIRDAQITLAEAVTWFATAVGVAEAGATAAATSGALRQKLTDFVEAFKAANAEDEG